MIDLGTLGGAGSCANAINASGEVVGWADTASGDEHAFRYSDGKMIDLGTLGGASSSADAINASGEVVGSAAYDANGDTHAFLYEDGKMTDLGTLPGYTDSVATGINASGQIVGSCSSYTLPAGSACHAFLYSDGTMIDLGPLPGGTLSWANGINDSGQVVGDSAYFPSGNYHAFLYNNGTMTDMGSPPIYFDSSYAYGINDSGEVAGYTDDADEGGEGFYFSSAFLYNKGKATELGSLGGDVTFAYGINDSGQVVGSSTTGYNNYRTDAFLYTDGAMFDLGALPGGSGSCANGINDSAQVVGYAYTASGDQHAFLLNLGAGASTTIAASPPQSLYGQPVTLTATITAAKPGAATPTGAVTFMEMDSDTTLGTGSLTTVNGVTTASITLTTLPVGSHSITALYFGDGNFCPGASGAGPWRILGLRADDRPGDAPRRQR